MRFCAIRCGRTVGVQRYIWSALAVFPSLPEEKKKAVRATIEGVAESAEEGRALYDILVRQKELTAAAAAAHIPARRLSKLRAEFYERVPL